MSSARELNSSPGEGNAPTVAIGLTVGAVPASLRRPLARLPWPAVCALRATVA